MVGSITRLFRSALRRATPTVGDIARQAGYSRITFDLYLNRRPPSRKAVLSLAAALERRAELLANNAARLREAIDEAPGGDES
jgi:hypothetical protein